MRSYGNFGTGFDAGLLRYSKLDAMAFLRRLVTDLAIGFYGFVLFFSSMTMGFAQNLVIYPVQGQKPEQQQKDRTECAEWAKNETNIDPKQVRLPDGYSTPSPTADYNHRGVAVGGVTRVFPEDPGGAVEMSPEQRVWRQQASAYGHAKALYQRAYGLCLEDRGYTVK